MQLNKNQATKAETISYLLLLLVRTINFDQLVTYLQKQSNCYNFLMTMKCLIYFEIEWNLNDVIISYEKNHAIDLHNLDSFMNNILSKHKINANANANENKFINCFFNKEILSEIDLRDTYSNLLVCYFENLLDEEICSQYYNALQSWIDLNTI